MSRRRLEPLLADVVAQVGEADAPALPQQLVDQIITLGHDLEQEMFSTSSGYRRHYVMARDIVVAGLRFMREVS